MWPSRSASSLSSAALKAAHQRRASLSASSLSSAELKAAHQRRASLSASSLTTAELKAAHRLRQYYRMAAEGGQEQAEAALGEARVQQQLRAAVATWFRRRAHPLRRAITRVSASTRRRIVDRLARRYIDSLHRWETWTRDAHQLMLAQSLALRVAQGDFLASLHAAQLEKQVAEACRRQAVQAHGRAIIRQWRLGALVRRERSTTWYRLEYVAHIHGNHESLEDLATKGLALRRLRRRVARLHAARRRTSWMVHTRAPTNALLARALASWRLVCSVSASIARRVCGARAERRCVLRKFALHRWHVHASADKAQRQAVSSAMAEIWWSQMAPPVGAVVEARRFVTACRFRKRSAMYVWRGFVVRAWPRHLFRQWAAHARQWRPARLAAAARAEIAAVHCRRAVLSAWVGATAGAHRQRHYRGLCSQLHHLYALGRAWTAWKFAAARRGAEHVANSRAAAMRFNGARGQALSLWRRSARVAASDQHPRWTYAVALRSTHALKPPLPARFYTDLPSVTRRLRADGSVALAAWAAAATQMQLVCARPWLRLWRRGCEQRTAARLERAFEALCRHVMCRRALRSWARCTAVQAAAVNHMMTGKYAERVLRKKRVLRRLGAERWIGHHLAYVSSQIASAVRAADAKRTFRAWKAARWERWRHVRRWARALDRHMRTALLGAWDAWAFDHTDCAFMRRVRQRWVHREASRALRTWAFQRELFNEMFGRFRCALGSWRRAKFAGAWRAWRQLTQECVEVLSRFRCALGSWRRAKFAGAWRAWRQMAQMTTRTAQLTRVAVGFLLKRGAARALRTWEFKRELFNQALGMLRRASGAGRLGNLARAWCALRWFSVEWLEARDTLQTALGSWQFRALAGAWHAWAFECTVRAFTQRVQHREVHRKAARALRAWAFQRTVGLAFGTHRRLLISWHLGKLASAWRGWRRLTEEYLEAINRLRRVLVSWRQGAFTGAWRAWRQRTEERLETILVLQRVLGSWRSGALASAWRGWRELTAKCRETAGVMRGALSRLLHQNVSRALGLWRAEADARLWAEALVAKLHPTGRQLQRALNTWRAVCEGKARVVMACAGALRDTGRRTVADALGVWRDWAAEKRTHAEVVARAHARLESLTTAAQGILISWGVRHGTPGAWATWQGLPALWATWRHHATLGRSISTLIGTMKAAHAARSLRLAASQWRYSASERRRSHAAQHAASQRWLLWALGSAVEALADERRRSQYWRRLSEHAARSEQRKALRCFAQLDPAWRFERAAAWSVHAGAREHARHSLMRLCLRTWAGVAALVHAEHLATVRSLASLMDPKLRRSWQSWVMHVDEMNALRLAQDLVSSRYSNSSVVRAFFSWYALAQQWLVLDVVSYNCGGLKAHQKGRIALDTWAAYAATLHTVGLCVRRWTHRKLGDGLVTWRALVATRTAAWTLMARALALWERSTLKTALDSWYEAARTQVSTQLAVLTFTQRRSTVVVADAWRMWRRAAWPSLYGLSLSPEANVMRSVVHRWREYDLASRLAEANEMIGLVGADRVALAVAEEEDDDEANEVVDQKHAWPETELPESEAARERLAAEVAEVAKSLAYEMNTFGLLSPVAEEGDEALVARHDRPRKSPASGHAADGRASTGDDLLLAARAWPSPAPFGRPSPMAPLSPPPSPCAPSLASPSTPRARLAPASSSHHAPTMAPTMAPTLSPRDSSALSPPASSPAAIFPSALSPPASSPAASSPRGSPDVLSSLVRSSLRASRPRDARVWYGGEARFAMVSAWVKWLDARESVRWLEEQRLARRRRLVEEAVRRRAVRSALAFWADDAAIAARRREQAAAAEASAVESAVELFNWRVLASCEWSEGQRTSDVRLKLTMVLRLLCGGPMSARLAFDMWLRHHHTLEHNPITSIRELTSPTPANKERRVLRASQLQLHAVQASLAPHAGPPFACSAIWEPSLSLKAAALASELASPLRSATAVLASSQRSTRALDSGHNHAARGGASGGSPGGVATLSESLRGIARRVARENAFYNTDEQQFD